MELGKIYCEYINYVIVKSEVRLLKNIIDECMGKEDKHHFNIITRYYEKLKIKGGQDE